MQKQQTKKSQTAKGNEDIVHRIEHAFTRKHASMLTIFTGILAIEAALNSIEIIIKYFN